MKISLFLALSAATASLFGSAAAFPAFSEQNSNHESPKYAEFLRKAAEIKAGKHDFRDLLKRAANQTGDFDNLATPDGGFGQRRITALINPANFKFNAEEQHIDLTSEKHKYIPPGPNDIRGPCPGLNLLANHGYFNRNGITNLFQGIDAINKVFGVEHDLALALNAYAVVFNGNILDLSWSIGGPYKSKSLGAVEDLLVGTPTGINAHNIYEGDASIVRQDYYAPGSNYDNVNVHLPYFEDLLKLGKNDATPGKDVYNAELMLQHKSNRWHESVATNPYFFQSAFGGLVVTTAAERFVAEFAANNTADENGYNRIYLDEPNLLAFFGVEKDPQTGKLTATPGTERLLPSWTRRPLAATFGLDDIVLNLLNSASIDPSLISLGGNTGRVNSFAGVDAGDISGGAFHTRDLLNSPQDLACFLYQAGIEELVPTQLRALYKVPGQALDFIAKNLNLPFKKLATAGNNPCDKFNSNTSQHYAAYPGSAVPGRNSTGLLGALTGTKST